MKTNKTLQALLALLSVTLANLFPQSARADLSSFEVRFENESTLHGIGYFLYDDDNGGDKAGFVSIKLDFSYMELLGPEYSNLNLSYTGNVTFGPGGVYARKLYSILTDPGSSVAQLTFKSNDFTPAPYGFAMQLVGPEVSSSYSRQYVNNFCSTKSAYRGEYALCVGEQGRTIANAQGQFIEPNSQTWEIPLPSSVWFLATGLLGLFAARHVSK